MRIVAALSFFAIIFSLISLTNHFCFHSSALDYGMFNQAMYSYSHFENATFTQSIDGSDVNYLCDHFAPVIILISPLYWVLGTYALLIVQITSLLLGAYFIYKHSCNRGFNERWSLAFAIFFLSIWGVYGALSFDFHTNVISTALIPVIVFLFYQKKWIALAVTTFIALCCKENSGILIFFLFVVLAIESRSISKLRNIAFIFSGISLLWVITVILYIMPSICEYGHANVESFYQGFGSNFREVIFRMISSPLQVAMLFIEDGYGNIAKSKVTTYWWLLFSGGLFVLLCPRYFIMLIPVLAQKFLSSNGGLWDINGHYSIEFVPIIVLAAISFCARVKEKKFIYGLLFFSVILALIMSWRGIISKNDKANLFSPQHYASLFSHERFAEVSSLVPVNAVLCCSSPVSPHMAGRKEVYLFPHWENAEFTLIHKKLVETYPLDSISYLNKMAEIGEARDWIVIQENSEFILYRRQNTP